MPDITMCMQENCPINSDCYRHEATPTPGRQSWAEYEPNADESCDMFLEIWPAQITGKGE